MIAAAADRHFVVSRVAAEESPSVGVTSGGALDEHGCFAIASAGSELRNKIDIEKENKTAVNIIFSERERSKVRNSKSSEKRSSRPPESEKGQSLSSVGRNTTFCPHTSFFFHSPLLRPPLTSFRSLTSHRSLTACSSLTAAGLFTAIYLLTIGNAFGTSALAEVVGELRISEIGTE